MSPLQYKIYNFIKEFLTKHGYSPTLLEIAEGVGISPRSKGLISRYVHNLVKSGRLAFDRKGYRNIYLPSSEKFHLPVEGKIAAGTAIIPLLQTEKEIIDLNNLFKEQETYVLAVNGDHLVGEGILNGDKIICKRQSNAKDGNLIIAVIEEQHIALKRIRYLNDERIELNSPYNSISGSIIYKQEHIVIKGIVMGILRILD